MSALNTRSCVLLLALVVCSISSTSVFANEPAVAAAEEMKASRIALFKHGFGYIERVRTVPTNQTFRTLVPRAATGTFWIELDGAQDLELTARTEKARIEESFVPTNLQQLLLAADGKRVNVWLADSDALSGVIRLVTNRDPESGIVVSRLAVLQQDSGETFVFQPAQLQRISFPKGHFPTSATRTRTEDQIVGLIRSEDVEETTVKVQHISDGISWVPSYVIDISAAGKARLACKALIVNDLEDLTDVDVELVVGFPNLKYANVVSPLLPSQELAAFLSQLGTGAFNRSGFNANSAFSNTLSQSSNYSQFRSPASGIATQADGTSVEDMFFYDAGRITLAKGQRSYRPLFTAKCDFKHIYEWEIIDYVDENSRFRQLNPEAPETVWHSVAILNETKHPWTTAAAMVVNDGRPLSQDTLNYTIPGGTATVRLTKALGVRPTVREHQLESPDGRVTERIWGSRYELVTVEGVVEVENTLSKNIEMEITKYLSGEIIEIEGEPTVDTITAGLRRINASRRVLWCPSIKSGEKWSAKYQYKVLINR